MEVGKAVFFPLTVAAQAGGNRRKAVLFGKLWPWPLWGRFFPLVGIHWGTSKPRGSPEPVALRVTARSSEPL